MSVKNLRAIIKLKSKSAFDYDHATVSISNVGDKTLLAIQADPPPWPITANSWHLHSALTNEHTTRALSGFLTCLSPPNLPYLVLLGLGLYTLYHSWASGLPLRSAVGVGGGQGVLT